MLGRAFFNSKRGFATAASLSNPLIIKNNRIQASVIVSRAPQLIRDATPFEQAYFDYREKLERQESTSVPTEFYFKKGSVAERRWKHDEKARQEALQNNNVSLTQTVAESQAIWEKENEGLSNAAISTRVEKQSRLTKADESNDKKSLDRSLKQTLYLVVKKNNNSSPWQFPEGAVDNSEYLHEAAERTLKAECGDDLDTWFVGRQPIGFYKQASKEEAGIKTFFMKARVYAGQVKPSQDVCDFAWLTKEELSGALSPEYYKAIKDSLSDL